MKNFEYAQPQTEAEAVELLAAADRQSVVLAGGTDLVGLMKRFVETPDRVVNICEIESLKQIKQDERGNVWIGAAVCLADFLDSSQTDLFPSVKQVIQGIASIQLQSQGTLAGELLRRPNCWYFRSGHGLLAGRGQLVVDGDNRYHAILGNRGAAKFVNASRLAPALISLGAQVRIIGPEPETEQFVDVEDLYRVPAVDSERENVLTPGQLVTHVVIPSHGDRLSAAYEVRQGEGPDQPLAASAVSLSVKSDVVQAARIVLGQVAPTPWVADAAAQSLCGKKISKAAFQIAGTQAVAEAMALSDNEYRIRLAQVSVQRALLRAVGMDTGGLDGPLLNEPLASPELDSQIA